MPAMQQDEVEAIAAALREARLQRRPIEAPSKTWPGLDERAAMAVQRAGLARALAEGDRLVGYKLGNIAKVMQAAFGLDQPDYGPLTAGLFVYEGSTLRRDDYIEPFVELEVGFTLRRPLKGPGVTVADVIGAVEYAVPAVEIIDSRVKGWAIGLSDTLADGGSTAAVMLAGAPRRLDQIFPPPAGSGGGGGGSLADLRGSLAFGGREVAAGNTRNVLGNPLAAVAWLANRLAEGHDEGEGEGGGGGFERGFLPGDFILPGSCLEAVRMSEPGHWTASFDGWASIEFDVV